MDEILRLSHISKTFPGVRALQDIAFDLKRGEVHCLCGENGAGKSTLIKILAGVHQPASGTLKWNGEDFALPSPRAAMSRGISVVHQDLGIIPLLSIYRNFFLGREEDAALPIPGF